jgi:hypothetical protein
MWDFRVLFDAVDKAVELFKDVNLRAVLRGDLQPKKICVHVRIGVEGRVLSRDLATELSRDRHRISIKIARETRSPRTRDGQR